MERKIIAHMPIKEATKVGGMSYAVYFGSALSSVSLQTGELDIMNLLEHNASSNCLCTSTFNHYSGTSTLLLGRH